MALDLRPLKAKDDEVQLVLVYSVWGALGVLCVMWPCFVCLSCLGEAEEE